MALDTQEINEQIVHLDGVDKTGKDTIKSALVNRSKGKILVIARSYISQIVYSRIYKRDIDEDFFKDMMHREYEYGTNFVLLTTTEEELGIRFVKHSETDLKVENIRDHLNVYEEVYRELSDEGFDIIRIDTTNKNIEENVDEILNSLKERQYE